MRRGCSFGSVARNSCGGPRCCWWCSGILRGRDCVGDDQSPAATRARQCQDTGWLIGIVDAVVIGVSPVWRIGPEQASDPGDIGGTVAVSEEAVVTDAVLAFWQNMDQEPADELVRLQGHGGVSAGAVYTVVLDAEGDAALIETDQAAVGQGDTVGVIPTCTDQHSCAHLRIPMDLMRAG